MLTWRVKTDGVCPCPLCRRNLTNDEEKALLGIAEKQVLDSHLVDRDIGELFGPLVENVRNPRTEDYDNPHIDYITPEDYYNDNYDDDYDDDYTEDDYYDDYDVTGPRNFQEFKREEAERCADYKQVQKEIAEQQEDSDTFTERIGYLGYLFDIGKIC
jgi:hypothetical protein